MVRAIKGHGLDRKFKPWRKGKSENAKSRKGTCKHQLRGQRRLLAKTTDPERRQAIEVKIAELEAYIHDHDNQNKVKDNASLSHGARFMERQKLTRLHKALLKNPNLDEKAKESELHKIALDMAYVAHYPHEFKYIPLFKQGSRCIDSGRVLKLRAKSRQAALKKIALSEEDRVKWISDDMYDVLPSEWSSEEEHLFFGATKSKDMQGSSSPVDSRFQTTSTSISIVEAAEKIDAQIDKEFPLKPQTKKGLGGRRELVDVANSDEMDSRFEVKNSRASSEMVGSKEDGLTKNSLHNSASPVGESSSSSDESSSSSSDEDAQETSVPAGKSEREKQIPSTSDSSSDSSSSSSSSDESDEDNAKSPMRTDGWGDSFLLNSAADPKQAFINAKRDREVQTKGDKSQGWATQKQRPGKYNKRSRN